MATGLGKSCPTPAQVAAITGTAMSYYKGGPVSSPTGDSCAYAQASSSGLPDNAPALNLGISPWTDHSETVETLYANEQKQCSGGSTEVNGSQLTCSLSTVSGLPQGSFETWGTITTGHHQVHSCTIFTTDFAGYADQISATAQTGDGSTYAGDTSQATVCGWVAEMISDSAS